MRSKNICKFIAPTVNEGLSITRFIYETDAETMAALQKLSQHRVALFTKGCGEINLDGRKIPCAAGMVVFFRPGEKVTIRAEKDLAYMYIDFSGSRAESLLRRFGIHAYACTFESLDGLIPLWQESLAHASAENIDLAAESILLYTLSRFSPPNGEGDDLLRRIVALSEEHFTDPDLSLSSMAEELGYNAKYLSVTFKKKMGVGYTEYLRTLRIKYAVSLLDHGLDSVKNIAFLSGFSDPLYFSSVFKASLGLSPKEYRQRLLSVQSEEGEPTEENGGTP